MEYIFRNNFVPNGVRHFLIREDEMMACCDDEDMITVSAPSNHLPFGSAPRKMCAFTCPAAEEYVELHMFHMNPDNNRKEGLGLDLIHYAWSLDTVKVEVHYKKNGETRTYTVAGALCKPDQQFPRCPAGTSPRIRCLVLDRLHNGFPYVDSGYAYLGDGRLGYILRSPGTPDYKPCKYTPTFTRLPVQDGDYVSIIVPKHLVDYILPSMNIDREWSRRQRSLTEEEAKQEHNFDYCTDYMYDRGAEIYKEILIAGELFEKTLARNDIDASSLLYQIRIANGRTPRTCVAEMRLVL